jgi:hypothetical protein
MLPPTLSPPQQATWYRGEYSAVLRNIFGRSIVLFNRYAKLRLRRGPMVHKYESHLGAV